MSNPRLLGFAPATLRRLAALRGQTGGCGRQGPFGHQGGWPAAPLRCAPLMPSLPNKSQTKKAGTIQ